MAVILKCCTANISNIETYLYLCSSGIDQILFKSPLNYLIATLRKDYINLSRIRPRNDRLKWTRKLQPYTKNSKQLRNSETWRNRFFQEDYTIV